MWNYRFVNKNNSLSGKQVTASLQKIYNRHKYSLNGYIPVPGYKSVYDNDFVFWFKRNSKMYDGPLARALKKQDFNYNPCNLRFSTTDRIELPHINDIYKDNKPSNIGLTHRHRHFYQPIHW